MVRSIAVAQLEAVIGGAVVAFPKLKADEAPQPVDAFESHKAALRAGLPRADGVLEVMVPIGRGVIRADALRW